MQSPHKSEGDYGLLTTWSYSVKVEKQGNDPIGYRGALATNANLSCLTCPLVIGHVEAAEECLYSNTVI